MSQETIDIILKYGKGLAILIVGLILIKIALHITRKALAKSSLDAAMHKFIINTVKIVLIILLAVALLSYLGVPAAPFVTVIGACGAAVALALKDSLGNVAGGIMILINKPFRQGDYINMGEVEGTVESIDLMVTTLKTIDNKVVIAPNGTVNTSVLTNYSREDMRRVDCTFAIGYDEDIAEAKEIMKNIAKSCPLVFNEPEPVIGVIAQNQSSVDIDFKTWCKTEDYWEVKYFLEESVKLAFDKAGITIPFPQMDVHLVTKPSEK